MPVLTMLWLSGSSAWPRVTGPGRLVSFVGRGVLLVLLRSGGSGWISNWLLELAPCTSSPNVRVSPLTRWCRRQPCVVASLSKSMMCLPGTVAWATILEKFRGTASALWRASFIPKDAWVASLPRLTAGDLRAAARKFKRRTGLGCDSIHPCALGWLSDVLSGALADFFMCLESKGAWPAAIRTILLAQIPKTGGGQRTIGLLPVFVRLWEKAR